MTQIAFDDTVGEVSGTWVTGRSPSPEPGLLLYIMVDSVAATVDAVIAQSVIGTSDGAICRDCSDIVGNYARQELLDMADEA